MPSQKKKADKTPAHAKAGAKAEAARKQAPAQPRAASGQAKAVGKMSARTNSGAGSKAAAKISSGGATRSSATAKTKTSSGKTSTGKTSTGKTSTGKTSAGKGASAEAATSRPALAKAGASAKGKSSLTKSAGAAKPAGKPKPDAAKVRAAKAPVSQTSGAKAPLAKAPLAKPPIAKPAIAKPPVAKLQAKHSAGDKSKTVPSGADAAKPMKDKRASAPMTGTPPGKAAATAQVVKDIAPKMVGGAADSKKTMPNVSPAAASASAKKAAGGTDTAAPKSRSKSDAGSGAKHRPVSAAAFLVARAGGAGETSSTTRGSGSVSALPEISGSHQVTEKMTTEPAAQLASAQPASAQAPVAAQAAPTAPGRTEYRPKIMTKPTPMPPSKAVAGASKTPVKPAGQRQGFKTNEFIVYPAHGVGQIIAIEEQEVAGFKLELFVINFAKDKMTLKVPTPKVVSVGMRKLAEAPLMKRALDTLTGRARIKRTMWSRRAQEYEAKINSGDLVAIAEVVRDLYRSEAQPEQSYSERQLYEAALDRMAREVAAVNRLTDSEALKLIESQLQKGPRRGAKLEAGAEGDGEAETDAEGDVAGDDAGSIEEAA